VSPLKKLAGQTALYGIPTIAAKFINYLLVFVHSRVFLPQEYGVFNNLYSYVAFLLIIFTYGMETAFFRFSTKEGYDRDAVYSTGFISLLVSSAVLFLAIALSSDFWAGLADLPDASPYVRYLALILMLDAISSIPFVRLRLEERAKRFALIKVLAILINVFLNLFFLLLCPYLLSNGYLWVSSFYNPEFGVGYTFLSNLTASLVTFSLLLPEVLRVRFRFDLRLWKEMIVYALPLLPAGLAGMVNETIDRILLVKINPDKAEGLYQTGIYGANYKLAMLMTLFVQAFRYASEPFFFSQSSKEKGREIYATVMNYFVLICAFIFLGVTLYIDIAKVFIGEKYHEGLFVVPVLLLANLCFGIYTNISIWYKLTGQTRFGLYITFLGAAITLVLNFLWIPVYGYAGSAWATLICYIIMMMASYYLGQRYYPVNYNVSRILFYIGLSLLIYFLNLALRYVLTQTPWILIINTALLLCFVYIAYRIERVKKVVP
jgi:O-antigen/teichoic acid export membrane protein